MSATTKWIRWIAIGWGGTAFLILAILIAKSLLKIVSGDIIFNANYDQISPLQSVFNAIMGSICLIVGTSPLFLVPIFVLTILKSNRS